MTDSKIRVVCDIDLEDLIPGFLENRLTDIESITSALESSDMETIRIIGHSMKGSGGGYGFDAITDLGGRIEQFAMASDSVSIESAISELKDYLGRLDITYEEI